MSSAPDKVLHARNLPALPLDSWKDTQATLHLWTQVVGKIRLALTPLVNHWWNVPLYVTARGLTTSPMPYGDCTLEILFDFIDHKLLLETSDARVVSLALKPQTVAAFYDELMRALSQLDMPVKIWTMPCELSNAIPFEKDTVHASYDAGAAHKFWEILVWADSVMKDFRAGFIGKASPIHFFWGSFDLAVTRFSGRPAPPASRRRLHYARGVFARGQQRRLLGRRRRHQRSGVLLVRRARAGRLLACPCATEGGLLSPRHERVSADVRRHSHDRRAGAALAGFLSDDL